MKRYEVEAAQLIVGDEAPLVQITMDIRGWDYILSIITRESEHNDETVRIIRDTCRKALFNWVPSVHDTVGDRRPAPISITEPAVSP